MIPYTNQMQEYEFDIEVRRTHHKEKKKYNNSILTFDIETTSAWLENGVIIPYRKGETAEYWNNLEPMGLCYIWQFSCDGKVYYGRELREFEKVLQDIPSDMHTIIWVHNLSFEFAWLSDFIEWSEVFARTPHKPMKAIPKKYPHIEFRCSYMLTRLSLDAWGKQIGLPKMVGDLDYDKMRTPLTELTPEEMHYCERDCEVVEAGIKQYLKQYGTLRDIPLTQTGTVRREVKEKLTSDAKYVQNIKKLVPASANEYALLQEVFAGGYTHANRFYSGKVIEDEIEHYDFASSYPTVMCCEKYPMTPWIAINTKRIPAEHNYKDIAYIMHLKFYNITTTSFNTYIQSSKCTGKGMKFDNGRVMSASELEITITEQDYLTISKNYDWKRCEVIQIWKSYKDYLPKVFIEYILELYGNKTKLKNVEGFESLYNQSKQYVNSLFGMCVTSLVQADVTLINNDEWIIGALTKDLVNAKLDALRRPGARNKKYFLSFSWGCYITAYARRNLWRCIESVDHDVLYCDTDSIFVIGKHDFSWYDNEVTAKLKKACDDLNIDFDLTRPCTPKGIAKPLGVFSKEDDCIEFITLGAKRYCERREDGKLYLTISGINKDAVKLLEDDLENFKDGFEFNADADCVTKKLCTYLTKMPSVVWPDGYTSTYTHGINLRRTGYKLGVTDEYKQLIYFSDFDVNEVTDYYIQKARSMF